LENNQVLQGSKPVDRVLYWHVPSFYAVNFFKLSFGDCKKTTCNNTVPEYYFGICWKPPVPTWNRT